MSAGVLTVIAVGFIIGILALQVFLFAMLRREQVKKDLVARVCQPIQIRWRPFSFWQASYHYNPTKFKVIFSDPLGSVHKASCIVYLPLRENPLSGSLCVEWLTDTVISEDTTGDEGG